MIKIESMRFLSEAARAIGEKLPRPIRVMEVSGTHTVNILRYGLQKLLPKDLELVSGPGCPVCVTPTAEIDFLIKAAKLPDVILASFGDMLQIPGSNSSLKELKDKGASIEIVYSPLDTLELAETNPDRYVIFAAIGFESIAPAMGVTVLEAKKRGLKNLGFAVSQRILSRGISAVLSYHKTPLDGIILPGDVCTIIGAKSFQFLARDFHLPAVITGFKPTDIMQGIYMLVSQISEDRAEVEIQYRQVVTWEGNQMGKQLIRKVFEPCDVYWRGLGLVSKGGLCLRQEFKEFDARLQLNLNVPKGREPVECLCGEILCGRARPPDCKLFGKACSPDHPKGPCMVSNEGVCAAWYTFVE